MADGLVDQPDLEPIDLAHQPAFRLGALEAYPATRQVARDGKTETLEPRVMQVLVALARAQGAVVSREDLVASCWGGRIVGDNAINRVISRLRALSAAHAGVFEIGTIARVGYRLSVGPPPREAVPPAAQTHPPGRRAVLALGLITVGGIGGYAFLSTRRHRPSAAAVALYRKGLESQQQGLPEQTAQAVSYLREAVRIDPGYADAWGALALSYRHQLESDSPVEAATVAGWITGAANRALQLDPKNADAQVAKTLIRPNYRNWTAAEADYRSALARHPDHWLLRGTFGRLMYEVGRWGDGIPRFSANVAAQPFLPLSRYFLAYGLWSAGRWQEAEAVIEAAYGRWPSHPSIWFLRFDFLVFTGRAAAATAFASDIAARPLGVADFAFEVRLALAAALRGGGASDVDRAATAALRVGQSGPGGVPWASQALATLGRTDAAFDLLRGYFEIDRPVVPGAAPIGPLTRRSTDVLFAAPTASLRTDPRFTALTQAIGLEAYWTGAGVVPDYRRREKA